MTDKKYNTYIKLSENYESVVDIDSESRNPKMWQEYIVHEDMKDAIEIICDSFRFEDKDKRRSFWIHGSYGTGKTYAAIVLKHLFEDEIENISDFLSREILLPYKDKFLNIRKKGKFLVIWQNQTTDIKSSAQLLLTMENAIREKLKDVFGDKADYGTNSLIDAAKRAINDNAINWESIFADYRLDEEYSSLDEFKEEVSIGKPKAANLVATIYREKGFGFITSFDDFKKWVKEVIEKNGLKETGIVFIWDEFTNYLRNNPTDNVLQSLSEFAKVSPFYMCLIVHKSPGVLQQIDENVYERIVDRFHSLEFNITDSAAYELIGNSILIRSGMGEQWKKVKKQLMQTLENSYEEFDNLDMHDTRKRLSQLCPLHPMTLILLTLVARYFQASQRTLFQFMKDLGKSETAGFIYYINKFGPAQNEWYWLTPDFLWDYFFIEGRTTEDFPSEAKSAYQHYMNTKDSIADETNIRIFKTVMLLIAIVSSGKISNQYGQTTQNRVSDNKETLIKCFLGKLDKKDIEKRLAALEEVGAISIDKRGTSNGRLQIPYTGSAIELFDAHKKTVQDKYSRNALFKKGGIFAKVVEDKVWDKNNASYNRMAIAVCDSATVSIKSRYTEIQDELSKAPYKFGILAITISESSKYSEMQDKIKTIAADDTTGRMAVILMREPFTDDKLVEWQEAITHHELAAEQGKTADADRYATEAEFIVSGWADAAVAGRITAVYKDRVYNEYGTMSIAKKLEKDIIFGMIFAAAPELIVTTNTLYKRGASENYVGAGVEKLSTDSQMLNIVNGLKAAKVWDEQSLEAIANSTGDKKTEAIAKIARYISDKFSAGTQIPLDALWFELQEPPYGYYNSLVCGYILGFLFKHYINREFTWNRADNNACLLDKNAISSMVVAMLKDKATNHYLSPGSETWQKFRDYAKEIFKLANTQVVNEIDARKYMAQKCTSDVGVPFWSLKYVDEDKFGGTKAKKTADEIIDLFCTFIAGSGDQKQLMGEIIEKFSGNGKIRKNLETFYSDGETSLAGFINFIYIKCPQLKDYEEKLDLTKQELIDAIKMTMQGELHTWTEKEVEERLQEVCVVYRVVAALNAALKDNKKTIGILGSEIANVLDNMLIPGSVIEEMGYSWIPTLKIIHNISKNQWAQISSGERASYADFLEKNAKQVWGLITSPKPILEEYIGAKGISCTDKEMEDIYGKLTPVKYDFSVTEFESRIQMHLNNIEYGRNKACIKKLWKEQSGFDSIADWCNAFSVPIQWVVNSEEQGYIFTLKNIQDNKQVVHSDLKNACQYFEKNTIKILKDKKRIKRCFLEQIGIGYSDIFKTSEEVLIERLKADDQLTSDVYTWNNKVKPIREILDAFIREKYCEKAKEQVQSMGEKLLKEKVIKLLDQYPELYTMFLKKEE